ncbi:MAG TPA: hypothetical protein VM659_17375 [Dongiaceae bacterium]|nr:hypothetical protein [Dongiaceae bacterium]
MVGITLISDIIDIGRNQISALSDIAPALQARRCLSPLAERTNKTALQLQPSSAQDIGEFGDESGSFWRFIDGTASPSIKCYRCCKTRLMRRQCLTVRLQSAMLLSLSGRR